MYWNEDVTFPLHLSVVLEAAAAAPQSHDSAFLSLQVGVELSHFLHLHFQNHLFPLLVAQASTEAHWQKVDLKVKQTQGDQSAGPEQTNNVHFIHHIIHQHKIKGLTRYAFERYLVQSWSGGILSCLKPFVVISSSSQ
jgi:hypothetical protein